jgi:hypothetical protein
MSNGNGNGNGEVKKLVELKHTFRAEASQLEEDLRAKFTQELETAEKGLKDKYLEQVVDWFYGGGFNGNKPQPQPEPEPANVEQEPEPIPEPESTTPEGAACSNCGADLQQPDANFCSQCAAPVETPAQASVATAGRLRKPVAYQSRRPLTADERLRNWSRTQRR